MGQLQTKTDIYKVAYSKIYGNQEDIRASSGDSFSPQNQTIDVLSLIIASEMEEFKYPFAFKTFKLENEIIDAEITTNSSGDKISAIYSIPDDVVSVLGIYKVENIPNVSLLLNKVQTIADNSMNYRLIGRNRILISLSGLPKVIPPLFTVYTSSNPEVKEMPNLFQQCLVFRLAAHIYTTYGKNSNILRAFNIEYKILLQKYRKYVLENNSNYTQVLPTIIDVIYNAGKDGTVYRGY